MAEYLLQVGVRYIAYAWLSEAMFPEKERDLLLNTPWISSSTNAAFDFQRNLTALMRTRHLLFEDGERALIDLAVRATP
jgi:hypothetical protein